MLMLPGKDGGLYSVHPEGVAGKKLYADLIKLQEQGAQSVGLLVSKNPHGSGVSYLLQATRPTQTLPSHLSYHHLTLTPGQLPHVAVSLFPDSASQTFNTSFSHYSPIFPFVTQISPFGHWSHPLSYPAPPPTFAYTFRQQNFSQTAEASSGVVTSLQSPDGTISPISDLNIVRLLFANGDKFFCMAAQKLFTASSLPTTSDDEIEKSLIDLIKRIPVEQLPSFVTLCSQRLAKLEEVSHSASNLSESHANLAALEKSPDTETHKSSTTLPTLIAQELPHALPVASIQSTIDTSHAEARVTASSPISSVSFSPALPSSVTLPCNLLPALPASIKVASEVAAQNFVPEPTKKEYNPTLGAWNKKLTIAPNSSIPSAHLCITPIPPAQRATIFSPGKDVHELPSNSAFPAITKQQKHTESSAKTTHTKPCQSTQQSTTTFTPPITKSVFDPSVQTYSVSSKSQTLPAQAEGGKKSSKQRRREESNDFFLAAAAPSQIFKEQPTNSPKTTSTSIIQKSFAANMAIPPSSSDNAQSCQVKKKEKTATAPTFKEERERKKRENQDRLAEHKLKAREAITAALAENNIVAACEHLHSLPDIKEPVYIGCLLEILKALNVFNDDTSSTIDTSKIARVCQDLLEALDNETQFQLLPADHALLLTYLSHYGPEEYQEKYMLQATKLTQNLTNGLVFYTRKLITHKKQSVSTPCTTETCIHTRAYHFIYLSISLDSQIKLNPLFHSVGWLAGPSGCGRVKKIQSENCIASAKSNLNGNQRDLDVFMGMVMEFPATSQAIEASSADAEPAIASATVHSLSLKEQALSCAVAIESKLFTKTGSIQAEEQVVNFFRLLPFQEQVLTAEYLLKTHPRAAFFFITVLMKNPFFKPYAIKMAPFFQPLLQTCITDTEKSNDSETSTIKCARARIIKQLNQLQTSIEALTLGDSTSTKEHEIAQLSKEDSESISQFFDNLVSITFTGKDAAVSRNKFIFDTLRDVLAKTITATHILYFLNYLRQQSAHPDHTAIVKALQDYIRTLSFDKKALWESKMAIIHFESLNMKKGTPFQTKILPLFEKELREFVTLGLTDPKIFQDAVGLITKLLRYPQDFGTALDIVLKNATTFEASFYWTSFYTALAQQKSDQRVQESVNTVSRKVLATIDSQLQKYENSELFAEFITHLKATRSHILSTLEEQESMSQATEESQTSLVFKTIIAYKRAVALPTGKEKEKEMATMLATFQTTVLNIKNETDATTFASVFSTYSPPELKNSLLIFLQTPSRDIPDSIRKPLLAACKPAKQVSEVPSVDDQVTSAKT